MTRPRGKTPRGPIACHQTPASYGFYGREKGAGFLRNRVAFGLLLLYFAVALVGCGRQQGAEASNPIAEVAGPADFASLGFTIDAPEGAQDAGYAMVSDTVAQVEFTLDGRRYCYRASREAEDFSGVNEAFEDEALRLNALYDGYEAEVEIRTTLSGGRLAAWSWDDVRYSLYTADPLEDDTISSLSLRLADASHATAGLQAEVKER